MQVTSILLACLAGMATTKSVSTRYCRVLALGTLPAWETSVSIHQDMHWNCCDWAGVTSLHYKILSNCFEYFFPLSSLSFFTGNLDYSRKPLLMFQVERSHAGHCTPRETFRMKVCSEHTADLPGWADCVSRSCTGHVLSLPARGCEMKDEAVSEGDSKVSHVCWGFGICNASGSCCCSARNRVFPCSRKVSWLQSSKPSSPHFPLLHGNRIVTCPLGVEENTLHIFPHHCLVAITLSPGLLQPVAAMSPLQTA